MAQIKRRKCCVPYCNNVQEISKKQFFKIGANLEGREKWSSLLGKAISAKSQILFCCEDHFDLPNDAENYIRCKYIPKTKLKLRPNVLPQKNLPVNVCRLCLKLIYNRDSFVEISEKKGNKNAQIIAATLPELDLSITLEPVACLKCFEPLEKYYEIKQNALNSEMVVVNCIKLIVKRSPSRLVKNCEIDLFEEYNDIVELLEREKERTKINEGSTKINEESSKINEISTLTQVPSDVTEEKREIDKSPEKIIIQIEEQNDDIYKLEVSEKDFQCGQHSFTTAVLLTSKNTNEPLEDTHLKQKTFSVVENVPLDKVSENNHDNPSFISHHVDSSVEHNHNVQYQLADSPMELSSENMYIHIEKESSEDVEIVTAHL